jgi:hypothetical protein
VQDGWPADEDRIVARLRGSRKLSSKIVVEHSALNRRTASPANQFVLRENSGAFLPSAEITAYEPTYRDFGSVLADFVGLSEHEHQV